MRNINLSQIDICNSIVGLMYKGNRRYKSILGGIISLFLMTAILSIIISFLNDFFGRTKVKMTFEQIKYNNPPNLNISNNFFFIIMTQYQGINVIRDDILQINAVLKSKQQGNWVYSPIDLIPCDEILILPIDVEDKLELSKGVCFNTSQLTLKGSNVNDIYQYIQILFNLCLDNNNESDIDREIGNKDNKNSNNHLCYPQDKMETFFQQTKPVAFIYFLDSAFQIYNHTKIAQFYNSFDINITYQNSKVTNMLFSYNEMLVDESYFFPSNPERYGGFVLESTREQGAVRYDRDCTVNTFNLMSSNYKTVLHISYMQVTELLASICAMINVLVIIANVLGNYFNHYLFQSDLLNSFYESDIPDNRNSYNSAENKAFINIKLNSKFPLNSSSSIQTHFIHPSSSILTSTNSDKTQVVTHIIHRKKCDTKHNFDHSNIIKLSFGAFVPCFLTKSAKEQFDVFNQMNKSLLYYQEMTNGYKKLMEIDLIKYLILNEEQLTLYKIIPKPQYNNWIGNQINKGNRDFCSLIHDDEFHFLKSKEYIEKALNSNKEIRELFVSNGNVNKSEIKDRGLNDKLVELIKTEIIVCSINKEQDINK